MSHNYTITTDWAELKPLPTVNVFQATTTDGDEAQELWTAAMLEIGLGKRDGRIRLETDGQFVEEWVRDGDDLVPTFSR